MVIFNLGGTDFNKEDLFMTKDYVSRYMDINRCDIIMEYEPTCEACGAYLEDIHRTNFEEGIVEEYSICTGCQQLLEGRLYRLQ